MTTTFQGFCSELLKAIRTVAEQHGQEITDADGANLLILASARVTFAMIQAADKDATGLAVRKHDDGYVQVYVVRGDVFHEVVLNERRSH